MEEKTICWQGKKRGEKVGAGGKGKARSGGERKREKGDKEKRKGKGRREKIIKQKTKRRKLPKKEIFSGGRGVGKSFFFFLDCVYYFMNEFFN